jgi:hypothetical protein
LPDETAAGLVPSLGTVAEELEDDVVEAGERARHREDLLMSSHQP